MDTPVETLTLNTLRESVSSGAAFRCRRRLQPAGGPGDKVFPPTYAGAVYAVEKRRIPGFDVPVDCVLLDSVQSQANRIELALQQAIDAGRLAMPLIEVDFSDFDPTGDIEADRKAGRLLDRVGKVTSLQVPHRLADAILRDSELEGEAFRASRLGRPLNTASYTNATPLFTLCPTALVFGMWDSTGPKGGLGAKFERALVSEVIGIDAAFGVKTQSRVDPLIAGTAGITLYRAKDGGWTLNDEEAEKEKGKPVPLGRDKKGKVSEANLGNITPGFHKYADGAEGTDPLSGERAHSNRIAPGGVTIDHAEQLTTVSLIVLRRLRFPLEGGEASEDTDDAARTVLAALGLAGAALAFESGMGLRSRCLLWPDDPMEWELLQTPGHPPRRFALTAEKAVALLTEAVEAARKLSLPWNESPIQLKPSAKLAELVRRSQLRIVEQDLVAEA